jgi:hypothetical protein
MDAGERVQPVRGTSLATFIRSFVGLRSDTTTIFALMISQGSGTRIQRRMSNDRGGSWFTHPR